MTSRLLAFASLLLLPTVATADTPPSAPASASTEVNVKAFGGRVTGAAELTATIESVDTTTRAVTLRTSDGQTLAFTAGPEVRNLAQMKAGDRLDLVIAEELSIIVTNTPGEPERTDSIDAARAAEGEKPGMVVVKRSSGAAIIDAIDYEKRTATLRGPHRTLTIEASAEAKHFHEAKVGDRVLLEHVQTILISVSAP